MKLSALKKEILLVLLDLSNGGNQVRAFGVGLIFNEINKKRPAALKRPGVDSLAFVCVQRSLERLVRDGLLYVERSRRPSLHSYFLNSRGERKAREIETEIRNYMYRWWKFIKK